VKASRQAGIRLAFNRNAQSSSAADHQAHLGLGSWLTTAALYGIGVWMVSVTDESPTPNLNDSYARADSTGRCNG